MTKHYILLAILLLASMHGSAQTVEFDDDMESYIDGSEIFENHWTSWSGTSSDAIFSSSAQARSGSLSGFVPDNGTTDGVLDFGNKIFGEWFVIFHMYVPSNKEAYWNLQGEVPIGAGEWVVGNIFFNQDLANPGVGLIDDSALGAVSFDFPHDEWFEVFMEWDITFGISLATWGMNIDGVEVIPYGTPYTSADGTTATSLGGIDFFSISANNSYYIDDFLFSDFPLDAGTIDFNSKDFQLINTQFNEVLQYKSNETISEITLHNMLGQIVYKSHPDRTSGEVDISNLPNGTYLAKVAIGDTTGTIKFVK